MNTFILIVGFVCTLLVLSIAGAAFYFYYGSTVFSPAPTKEGYMEVCYAHWSTKDDEEKTELCDCQYYFLTESPVIEEASQKYSSAGKDLRQRILASIEKTKMLSAPTVAATSENREFFNILALENIKCFSRNKRRDILAP